ETGEKGATLIAVEDGRIASVTPRALDVVRWTVCPVDASEAASAEDVVELSRLALSRAVANGEERTIAARVAITGVTRAHPALVQNPEQWDAQIRLLGRDVGGDDLWVERVD